MRTNAKKATGCTWDIDCHSDEKVIPPLLPHTSAAMDCVRQLRALDCNTFSSPLLRAHAAEFTSSRSESSTPKRMQRNCRRKSPTHKSDSQEQKGSFALSPQRPRAGLKKHAFSTNGLKRTLETCFSPQVSSAPLTLAGGSKVAWNPHFRLVFVTPHATPSFGPAVYARVTVINFAITPAGLEEQLLIEAVKQENPELEEQRDALVVAIAEDTRRKHKIEEDILTLLAGVTGDILVDDRLVDVLAASKRMSDDLRKRLQVAEETTLTLDRARDLFRGVAARGALLYFVVAALSRLNAVYRQSLNAFLRVFRHVLEETQGEKGNVAQRVTVLQRELTLQVYRRTCHGLFERHKFCFAFLLALAIDKRGGVASKEAYDFLVRGCPASDDLHARVKDVARVREPQET